MTPPRPVEEVARAMGGNQWEVGHPLYRELQRRKAIAAFTRLRELGMLNPETLDLLKHEGQYEATQPERYRFKEKTE